jgi:hypothetical protein
MTPLPPAQHDVETVRFNSSMTGHAPIPLPPEGPSFEELHRKFREFKHSTNNALAIVMALSEMTARNPDHAKRLVQVVAEKGPQVVGQLRELDEIFKRLSEQKPPGA